MSVTFMDCLMRVVAEEGRSDAQGLAAVYLEKLPCTRCILQLKCMTVVANGHAKPVL